ncbi:hypothetical protein AB6A40_001752 [Gnathostoma spinigerum]|uniref:Uncharacterized protein n=1 Tax=Gnathostoma spinigerum TaxID=75299 RepID=A0ABD6EDW6_9BILA
MRLVNVIFPHNNQLTSMAKVVDLMQYAGSVQCIIQFHIQSNSIIRFSRPTTSLQIPNLAICLMDDSFPTSNISHCFLSTHLRTSKL